MPTMSQEIQELRDKVDDLFRLERAERAARLQLAEDLTRIMCQDRQQIDNQIDELRQEGQPCQ